MNNFRPGFLAKLSRSNVFRVAAAYVVVAWIVLQVGSVLFATFEAPVWVLKVFTTLIFPGFPVALIISRAFELTPGGIKKFESGVAGGGNPRFKAALDGVARNIEVQKKKYAELKSGEIKS